MQAHKNNIGLLRLIFASLVIVGHAPEMLEGNRTHEPLTMLLHSLSLGELSVDAFFLLSGFLIAKSMVATASVGRYLMRRVLRIYPAFIVAYLLSVYALGPLVQAQPWHELPGTLLRLVTLQGPMRYPGQLPGMRFYPELNAAMWTISYEFRCYLLIALLGVSGLLARRWVVVALTAAALIANLFATYAPLYGWLQQLGQRPLVFLICQEPPATLRFTAIFLVGSSFYLYWEELRAQLSGATAAAGAVGAALLMYANQHIAESALATLGAVALFWLALKAPLGPLQKINDDWDISYGVYLYGWPVATYLRWLDPGIPAWGLCAATLPIAMAMGALSWWSIERRALEWGRGRSAAAPAP